MRLLEYLMLGIVYLDKSIIVEIPLVYEIGVVEKTLEGGLVGGRPCLFSLLIPDFDYVVFPNLSL